MTRITRILSIVISTFFVTSCISEKPILVNGKTPIYTFDDKQVFKAVEALAQVNSNYSEEVDALRPKDGEDKLGSAKVGLGYRIVGASGKGEDGSLVDGYVFLDKTKIRGGKGTAKRAQTEDLTQRITTDIVEKLNAIKKPIYVDNYKLD